MTSPAFLCFKPFTTIEIHTDGSCTFCCFIRKKIGNIRNSSLLSVFNSELAQDIRQKFYRNDYSECDKTRCSLFSTSYSTLKNISVKDPLYREDIYQSIAEFHTVIENGPSKIVESEHGLCNVKCTFCWPFQRYSRHQYPNHAYKLLLNNNSHVKEVHVAGGEPFYNPLIDSLLIDLINKNIAFGVTSNLTFLTESTKQLLNKSNIVYLNASINASSIATYDQLVQGGDWEKVCLNLDFFKTLRKSRPFLNLGISMVVNRINYQEIPSFVELGIDLYSVDSIVLHAPDEAHIPEALRLRISDCLEIQKMLKLPIFTEHSNKIYSSGLTNYLNTMTSEHYEREHMMSNSEFDQIPTHLTQDEKNMLQELASTTNGSIFVELGSYLGASSCYIASGIECTGKPAKLFCVDTWKNEGMAEGNRDTYDDFLKNTANFQNTIVPLRGKSEEIAKYFNAEIDFLFIDAGHDYENVRTDVLAWFPKLRAGAQVIFHDIGWAEGVQRVVMEHVLKFAYNEGALPNMFWACVSKFENSIPEETLHCLNQQRDPNNLIQRLLAKGIPVVNIDLDLDDFISWINKYPELFENYASTKDVIIEKCLEHYIANKLLELRKGLIYIDIAAAGSNWTDCLLNRGIDAYCLDLQYQPGINGNKIGANAIDTKLHDNSVDAMSLQSAFETFRGDNDKNFLQESKRILKGGGRVVISPLYLDTRHFILSGKNSNLANSALDEGSILVRREDEYDEDFSRHYSPEALSERLFQNLEGLSAKVIYIQNLDDFRNKFPGQRIYCDFNLNISKPQEPSVTDETADLRVIYNDEFYNEQKDASYKSAESIIPILMDVFNPHSVTDIGCGAGGWLHVFQKYGVSTIYGYDVNELTADKYFINKRHIKTNTDFSGTNFKIQEKVDLLICLEVVEHLPDETADSFILKLMLVSPVIIFSAALPGQTGVNHINEQPPWYWREKFNKFGYTEVDFIRPQILRNENICWWYRQNITCFVRPEVLSVNPKLAELATIHGQNDSGHKLTVINEWVLKHIMAGEHLTACPAKPEHANPFLSVIVPTRNRAALLYNALESITKQSYPANLFEVIVIDNSSTDATAEVCQHFKQRIPQFKYISAPHPGLHNGRHAGLKESIGEILVYADDDIEAMPTWLEAIASSFRDPKVALVGGKILPKFESQPPEWVAALSRKTDSGWSLGWYSILDFGDTEHEIPHEYVWGCNFSIRKNVLQQVGGFHPDSFPQEFIKYRGDGETAVSQAIRNMGLKAFYNPKASVYHVVSQNRLTKEYIYQRAHNQGISDSYTNIRTARLFSEEMQYKSPTNTIHDVVDRGYVDGFNYHQQLAKSDDALLNWILKESYINCEDVSL